LGAAEAAIAAGGLQSLKARNIAATPFTMFSTILMS